MFEDFPYIWAHGLYSLFDITNFFPLIPNVWEKQDLVMEQPRRTNKADVFLGYLVLFWILLYFAYQKCLNSLLRRMCFPLIQRNRIIEAAWTCGFCFGSICYFNSPMFKIMSFSSLKWDITLEELGILLHKSFYLHRAGISLLYDGPWMKGCVDLMLALFIFTPYQRTWCMILHIFLFYKAIDSIIINFCRIMVCVSKNTGRTLSKLLFIFHCFNWIYLHIFLIPKLMLWPAKFDDMRIELGVWIWFTAECLDSVWLKLCRCAKAMHWLEICIFPPPTREAIELASIRKRHRDSLKSLQAINPKKVELWQTIFYAMVIKKKIKRIRKAKQSNSNTLLSTIETDLPIKECNKKYNEDQ